MEDGGKQLAKDVERPSSLETVRIHNYDHKDILELELNLVTMSLYKIQIHLERLTQKSLNKYRCRKFYDKLLKEKGYKQEEQERNLNIRTIFTTLIQKCLDYTSRMIPIKNLVCKEKEKTMDMKTINELIKIMTSLKRVKNLYYEKSSRMQTYIKEIIDSI